MHRSRLAGFIIDCRTQDLNAAADFWGNALGLTILGDDGPHYVRLDGAPHVLSIEVQQVEHESRVHLDIETDDIEAEVKRLEALGATRHQQGKRWWVMQAPTGQRFCVVQARVDLAKLPGATVWP
jgi:catechol 2,3-dioxygenase-like lactoylglutathione lyase family enzyme